MNKLVELAKEIGKYEIGINEFKKIREAWRTRSSLADLVKNAGVSSADLAVRYSGLAAQAALLSASYLGEIDLVDAVGWGLVTELIKYGIHGNVEIARGLNDYRMAKADNTQL